MRRLISGVDTFGFLDMGTDSQLRPSYEHLSACYRFQDLSKLGGAYFPNVCTTTSLVD